MSPRINALYQLIAAQAVLMRSGYTYTAALWTTDPGNQASIASITYTGSTVTVTTNGAHGLTAGLPTTLTGIVSSGSGAHPLAALLNGAAVTPTSTPSTTSFVFTAPGGVTPTDTYTSGGVAGGGGEVSGGSYARQSITFQSAAPAVNNTAQINFVNMPAIAAPGSGVPTLYLVVIDSSSNYVDAGATNIVNTAITAGATVQFGANQVVGAFS